MQATEITPGLVLCLAFLGMTVAVSAVPPLYFIWRLMRTTRQENSQLLTAVLALSTDTAAAHLAMVRAQAEAKDVAAHGDERTRREQPRPRAVGAGG